LGADQVIPEKLEIAIDLFNSVLIKRLYPQKEVNQILTHIRTKNLGLFSEKDIINQPSLLDQLPNINIGAITIEQDSVVDGKSLIDLELRKNTGVTLLAVKRGTEIIEHPEPESVLQADDVAYVLGNPEQVNAASDFFNQKNF